MSEQESSVPSKEMVRKLRPAYAGIPDDAPFDRHLLIWSVGDVLRAAFISDMPESFGYRGRVYRLQQPYIGDWDGLVDAAGRLVGISIFVSPEEPLLRSDFLRRHKQLRLTEGALQMALCPAIAYEIECVQGVGTRFYVDSGGEYMFLFPEWCEWGEPVFPLASEEIPDMRCEG